MMFEKFKQSFVPDDGGRVARDLESTSGLSSDVVALLSAFGGASFNAGLYRVVLPGEVSIWNDRVELAFPPFGGRVTCFGYDWLGRVFATDTARTEDGGPGVVMFEPGTGQSLEIPCNIGSFHNEELIDYADAALATEFYDQWRDSGGPPPSRLQCMGYKKPLFLNGKDNIANLELSDLDVYWHIMGQLILKIEPD